MQQMDSMRLYGRSMDLHLGRLGGKWRHALAS